MAYVRVGEMNLNLCLCLCINFQWPNLGAAGNSSFENC